MIRKTLTKTKAVLEERGWGRDWVENDYLRVNDPKAGCVCLATAVAIACGYRGEAGADIQYFIECNAPACHTVQALETAVDASALNDFQYVRAIISIIAWNDAPGRTKEQVIELIDRTIEKVGDDARVSGNDVR